MAHKNLKWTFETYVAYNEARREDDLRFQEERDRRYREVNQEREKALRIKEIGDDKALQLAREIQTYKDEKANELREQINTERLLYAKRTEIGTVQEKYDAILKPVLEFVAIHQGNEKGKDKTVYYLLAFAGIVFTGIGLLIAFFK